MEQSVDRRKIAQSPAEVVDLVARAKAGDAEAFGSLFRQYRARAYGIARSYFVPRSDSDDLLQEATIGFYKAIRDFQSNRGAFWVFADLCVRRQVITYVKKFTRRNHMLFNRAISLDAPALGDESASLLDLLPSTERIAPGTSLEDESFLETLRRRCSGLERAILALYARGYSYDEIASEIGVHGKSINNAVWRVKVKARKIKNLLYASLD